MIPYDILRLKEDLTDEAFENNIIDLFIESPEGEADEKGEDKRSSIIGRVSVKVIESIEEKLPKVKTIEISESQGDISKLKYYKEFESIISILEGLEKSQGMRSDYVEVYYETFELLKSKKRNFKKAFKNSDKNLLVLFYIGLILYMIEMSSILSTCLMDWVKNGTGIDESINQNKAHKKIFLKTQDILVDDELDKFLNTDFNKKLISETEISKDFLLLYSETSLNDTIQLLKLGLAKFLYKVSSFIRFIIYLFYYCKFSFTKKIQKIRTTLDLYESERKDEREQLQREGTELSREYKVTSVDALEDTKRQIEKDKIDLKDKEGFKL